jgi:hypothetical protein
MAVGTALRTTVVGVLVLAAAACGEDGSTAAGTASQSLGSNLQSLDSTVTQITDADVDPETTTIGDTVQDLPSDETVAEAGSSVENAVQQLDTAWTNALDALNCSSGS